MEYKDLLPLCGVFVGWTLSLVTSGLEKHVENKRHIAKSLNGLIHLYAEVLHLKKMHALFKENTKDWDEYENYRKTMRQKHSSIFLDSIESLNKSLDDMACIYPIDAHNLRGLTNLFHRANTTSLAHFSKVPEAYIKFLSALEVGVDCGEEELNKCIKNLAFKHGIGTFLKTRKLLAKMKNTQIVDEYAEEFLTEFFDD